MDDETPKKSKYMFWVIILVIMVGSVVVGRFKPKEQAMSASDSLSIAQNKDLEDVYWGVRATLKESLRNPGSFEEISEQHYLVSDSTLIKQGVYIQVCIKYRAENGFGGINVEHTCYNIDKQKRITKTFAAQ